MKIIFDNDMEMSHEDFKKNLFGLIVEKFNSYLESDLESVMNEWTEEEVFTYFLMGKCVYDLLPDDVKEEIKSIVTIV